MEKTNITLGEKLKAARKSATLTQEQLAEKLLVSRQAITKWESDKGMPDIENLRRLSKLLNVSIDYLLDDGEQIDLSVTRDAINLDSYRYYTKKEGGKWTKKTCKKDMIVREKFPEAEINAVFGTQKLIRREKVLQHVLHWIFFIPFGVPDLIYFVKNVDKTFYLVNDADKQFFVTVTDEFIEIRKLSEKIAQNEFEIGDFTFRMGKFLIP